MTKQLVPQLITPVIIYPHRPFKDNPNQISGWYITLTDLFIPNINELIPSSQYVGVHSSLILTIVVPSHIKSLMGIALDLHKLPHRDRITWLTSARCYSVGQGCKYYIPSKIWNPAGEDFKKSWRTTAEIYWWTTPNNKETPYLIAEIPVLTRDILFNEEMKDGRDKKSFNQDD